MKKISKLLYILAASAFVFAACQQEDVYEPGEPEVDGCYGVYFPTQEAAGSHTYDPTADKVLTIKAARTNSAGDITVPVTISTNVDGVFQFESITFAAGQTETEFDVTFPNIATGVQSEFSLTIEDNQYASKYNEGSISIDCSILCVEWQYVLNPKTGEKAVVTFDQGYWGETAWAYVKYYEVDGVRTCETETFNHYYKGYYNDPGFFGTDYGELTFKWYVNERNSDGNQFLELPMNAVYYSTSYSAIVYTFDYCHYWNDMRGYSFDWLEFAKDYGDPDGTYPVGYYDGNGGFYFYTPYYYMVGIGGWSSMEYELVGIVDGYVRTDYTFDMTTDYSKDGVLPLYFEAGKDIASVKFAGFEGELTAAQAGNKAAEIEDGTVTAIEISTADFVENEDGTFDGAAGISLEATGTYTIVAVGYDANGTQQATAYLSAYYVAEGDLEENAVQISVATEAIPERFAKSSSYKEQNAFGYYIYGKDLEDVHIAIIEAAAYEKNADAYNEAIKAGNKYGVMQSQLDAINAAGGYETLATGLTADTKYAVVVWATNGILDTVVSATYTTAPNPEVWKSLGTATYTEDFITTFWDVENVSYELEVQESEERPGVYRLVNPYGAAYPYNEEGDWDASKDYYLEINASDPDAVYIDLQNLGIDWGYGFIYAYSYAAYYLDGGKTKEAVAEAGLFGTLKDGVITFPTKALFVKMPDYSSSLYYANTNGAFKVVLPSAATKSSVAAPAATSKRGALVSGENAGFGLPEISFQHESKNVEISVSEIAPRKAEGRKCDLNAKITVSE